MSDAPVAAFMPVQTTEFPEISTCRMNTTAEELFPAIVRLCPDATSQT